MKLRLLLSSLLFCFVLIPISCISQPEIVKQNCVGSHKIDRFSTISYIKDSSNYLMTSELSGNSYDGTLPSTNYNNSAILILLDSTFNIQWKKSLGDSLYQFNLRSISSVKSGGYIVAGNVSKKGLYSSEYLGQSSGSCINVIVLRLNEHYEVIWSKCYGSTVGTQIVTGITATSDGGSFVAANSTWYGNDIPLHYGSSMYMDGWYFKLDSLGNLLWSKVIGGSAEDGPVTTPIEVKPGYYLARFYSSSSDYDFSNYPDPDPRYVYHLFDSSGNVEIVRTEKAFTEFGKFRKFEKVGDTLIGIGLGFPSNPLHVTLPSHDSWEACILMLDTNYQPIFYKNFGGLESDFFYDYTRDEFGNYYFLGLTSSVNGDAVGPIKGGDDFWVLKTNANFDVQWSKKFGNNLDYEISSDFEFGEIFLKNNLIHVVVHTRGAFGDPGDVECSKPDTTNPISNDFNVDIWIVTLDLNTGIIIPKSLNEVSISLYPNPSKNEVTIESNYSDKVNSAKWQIVDLNGKVVYKTDFRQKLVVNAKNYKRGSYIVQLLNEKTLIASNKLILE